MTSRSHESARPATADAPPSVCDVLAATAARVPDAVAVTVDGCHFTYAQLRRAAHRLAARLRAAGVTREARVAILLDRSFDLLVALVGTLDAGGAYVPLDPQAPAARLTALARDAGAVCVVTDARQRGALRDLGLPIVALDDDRPGAAAPRAAAGPLDGDTLCYVMYTSGTTGEPKGVAVSHAALLNLLGAMRRAPGLTAADAWLAITPLTFDIAGLELWLPLLTGARLVLAPRHTAADGADLRARLAHENVSVLQATPATWRLLLDAGWPAPAGFRVLCGGEALPPELARQLLATAGHVWNCYGPTETTIWSTVECLQHDQPITIGRPIAKTRTYLLDRRFEHVDRDSTGELYIGGDGLARGYLGRPDLTAARFVPDPFGTVAGDRLYRTGDLARYRRDDRLECLGRIDHQIKIRGFRIEPGEIEHALGAHPHVSAAVVLAWNRGADDRHLVAYVTPAAGVRIDPAAVRAFLRDRLPEYLVPAIVIELERFRLTANGKIDRAALPSPEQWRPPSTAQHDRSVSALERTMAGVWARTLRVDEVGAHDNFFDLGGNSLLFAKVAAELREIVGREISILELFQYPTVALLAGALSAPVGDHPATAPVTPLASRAARQRRALAVARFKPGRAAVDAPSRVKP